MLLEQLNCRSSVQVMQHVEGTRNIYEILEGKCEIWRVWRRLDNNTMGFTKTVCFSAFMWTTVRINI